MAKNLVIVESPAKAKTIEKYLGSDFKVLSSMGHIRDLPKGMGIDVENNFQPDYIISPDKTKVVSTLKKSAKGKDVWLATDEDREGEAISWHLCAALKLDPTKTKRIVFHEITKSALEKAVQSPRTVDIDLVNAQQARRILDRLVGYNLSPVLWKKIQTGLSAGRVQSVAVRLVVEREREIEAFKQKSDYRVTAEFKTSGGDIIKAELNTRVENEDLAKRLLKKITNKNFLVQAVTKKPAKKSPPPPFTTSTLQQAAASRLGFSVKQTMMLAQRLYESGHITYMRTDSVNLAESATAQAEKVIKSEFGESYSLARNYKAKSANAQEAHEAIRPTNFKTKNAGEDAKQAKLYQLIWARTLASQMSDAQIEKTEAKLTCDCIEEYFIAKGEIVTFAGFLKAYSSTKQADPNILPEISEGEQLKTQIIRALQTYARPPARYSEASLVKKLEAEGIGRPSTYAPTISTIQARGYVKKSDGIGKTREAQLIVLENNNISEKLEQEHYDTDRSRLLPTDTANVVTDFLVKHFADIVDYKFTAKIENEFDNIAKGEQEWQGMIAKFYKPFHELINTAEDISRSEANQSRELGIDPKTKRPVIARLGKYGAMLQIGRAEDEQKPLFAPMPEGSKISDVTLDQALKMFELPRLVGKTKDGEEIIATTGRFGPYLKIGAINVSMGDHDPFSITVKEANKLLETRQEKLQKMVIVEFKGGVKVLNGRFGPYVTDGKVNAKIPKDKKPEKLTLKAALELLERKQK